MSEKPEQHQLIRPGRKGNNFKRYMERVSGGGSIARFCLQGIILTIAAPLPSIFASYGRGILYKALLGRAGKNCLIERNVTLHLPGRIFLENHVVIQEYSVLDPFDPAGRIVLKDHVQISRNSLLKSGKGWIEIDASVYIGPNAVFYGIGGIRIGPHCLIANNVQLLSGNHVFQDRNRLIKEQGSDNHPIVIGEDVWIGASAIVLGGVTIGRGAVIGAGSVVKSDIPEYGVAVGNPAKVVRMRGE
jgi:acetyltransferase-like isoleucine patch superfamily enzyme